jgi:hypothetical protein
MTQRQGARISRSEAYLRYTLQRRDMKRNAVYGHFMESQKV